MALANLNGSVELTTQNLEDLNNVKYDDATSALASLGRTINMGLDFVLFRRNKFSLLENTGGIFYN